MIFNPSGVDFWPNIWVISFQFLKMYVESTQPWVIIFLFMIMLRRYSNPRLPPLGSCSQVSEWAALYPTELTGLPVNQVSFNPIIARLLFSEARITSTQILG